MRRSKTRPGLPLRWSSVLIGPMGLAFFILPIIGAFGLGWKYGRFTLATLGAIIALAWGHAILILGFSPIHPVVNALIWGFSFVCGIGAGKLFREIVR